MAGVRQVRAGWGNIFRPWTLHGAVVPVLIGGAVAYHDGSFDLLVFILVLIASCLIQSASNILNTYGDFRKGTDTVENETRSPELVTGVLTPKQVLTAGILCAVLVCVLGLYFIWYSGWGILIIGGVGVLSACMYTVGLSYKYLGLGQAFVFVMMGILMPIGTYYVLTGGYSLEVLLLSLPNAFMITGVLSGNETRDYHEDRRAGVGTLSGHLSYEGSFRLYLFENSVGYVILALLIVAGVAPWGCALAYLALYDLWKLYRGARAAPGDPHENFMLVPRAFTQNWHFGVLLVAGFLITHYLVPVI